MTQSQNDDEISKVLFELASNRRATILFEVKKKNLKMQQIAETLDMTATETFRHLQRLSEADLLTKNSDGSYGITSLGNLAISMLTGFNFILNNRKYFLEHDPSFLPYELVNRLGELSLGEFTGGVLASFNRVRQMVFGAEEYIYVIADQVDSSHLQMTNEKVAKGMKFKFLMQKDLAKMHVFDPDFDPLKERRYIERVNAVTLINEKEAFFALRANGGTIDYIGFCSTDEKFRKWCLDLFEYYWGRAERWYPSTEIK
jgi:predicted transcriptional regulator